MLKQRLLAPLIGLTTAALAAPALAEGGRNPIFDARFDLQPGAQYTDTNAEVAVVVDPLPETKVDLDDMGIDDSATVFYAGAR